MWVVHKHTKSLQVPSTEAAYLVKGVCFQSLSQHKSKGVTEAVPGRALWTPAKPFKSK